MGQAKRRGTFEERKAEAIKKRETLKRALHAVNYSQERSDLAPTPLSVILHQLFTEGYYHGKVTGEQTQTLKTLGFKPVVRGGERLE